MKLKKTLSFLLALCLLLGNLPPAFAAGTDPVAKGHMEAAEKPEAPVGGEDIAAAAQSRETRPEMESMPAELLEYIQNSPQVLHGDDRISGVTEDDLPWVYDCSTGVVTTADRTADSVTVMSADYPTSGVCGDDLTWTFDTETGTLTISGTGDMYDYNEIDDPAPWQDFQRYILELNIEYGVTSIGVDAFSGFMSPYSPGFTTLTLPESVVRIAGSAFMACEALEVVNLPASVVEIDISAFLWCGSIKQFSVSSGNAYYQSVDGVLFNKEMTRLIKYPSAREGDYQIPSSVSVLGTSAFSDSDNLTSMTIPGTVNTVEDAVFAGCLNLTSLEICNGVTSLGWGIIQSCSITSITLPASMENISLEAFVNGYDLENIYVDAINPYFSSLDGVLCNKDQTTLVLYPFGRAGAYAVPNTITCIGESAFQKCSGLTSVIIPEGVTSIEIWAFFLCDGLTEISLPDSLTELARYAFSHCYALKEAVVPGGITELDMRTFTNSGLRTLVLQEGVQSVVGLSNMTYNYLEDIVLPTSLTRIGGYAFSGCSALIEITIPDNVREIGYGAFMGCYNLRRVVMPANDQLDLGNELFMNCDDLSIVAFQGNAPSFWTETFKGVTITAYYPRNDATWTENVLRDYGGTVTWVKGYAPFASGTCGDNLTWVLDDNGVLTISGTGEIPDNGETLSTWWELDEYIKTIKIRSGVTKIGANAFAFLRNVRRLRMPDTVTSIGKNAFYGCDGLVNVAIRSGVTEIGEQAFAKCDSLMTINFMGSSCSIGSTIFTDCPSIRELYFWEDPPVFSADAFTGITATAYYPERNSLWTDEVMQNYGGTLTWVMQKEEEPCSAAELTVLDYLAFSQIAYEDFSDSGSIRQNLADCWDDEDWHEELGITYGELCAHIAQWKVYDELDWSNSNGFYAVAFHNKSGEVVIAYRGSVPRDQWVGQGKGWDAWCDWIFNDLPMELLNTMGPQFEDAIKFYDGIASDPEVKKITTTGHSLGGAWADLVSAYSGCDGVSMNAVSMLDVAYTQLADKLAGSFDGIDQWNFVDHTNEYDILAGMFEHYLSTEIKPYIAHTGNIDISEGVIQTLTESMRKNGKPGSVPGATAISVLGDIMACHGLESLVTTDADGAPQMTGIASRFSPNCPVSNFMLSAMRYIDLGTSGNDNICITVDLLNYNMPRNSYGGSGDDNVLSSAAADTLIGGKGDDTLDGRIGNDLYLYYKGQGLDTIRDVSGRDTLNLYGFLTTDRIEIQDNAGENCIEVRCNGAVITKIMKQNRQTGDGPFKVQVIRDGDVAESFDLTDMFAESTLIGKILDSIILFRCPVDVEILDEAGNVVYTLEDGTAGSHYTQYGNFYVFQEEDGGYGKLLDLMEGYTARAVGVDTGTMSVSYQEVSSGVLSGAYAAEDIAVSSGMTAAVDQSATGQFYVKVDTNGDGTIDEEIAMENSAYGETTANGTCGDKLYWNFYTDGTLEITGSGEMANFEMQTPWLDHMDAITRIVIQEGVTTIGDFAFYGCAAESISIAESVSSIGAYALSACDNMESIHIPAGVAEIGRRAFAYSFALKAITVDSGNTNFCSVEGVLYSADMTHLICCPSANPGSEFVIPEGVTTLMNAAFCFCPEMTSLRLPDSLTTIHSDAIYNCFNLGAIVIPKNVSMIEIQAFEYNFDMTEILVDEENPCYSSQDGVLFNKDKTVLLICPQGKTGSYTVPDTVVTIQDVALYGCKITEWVIPGSVAYIGEYALNGDSDPVVIRFLGNAPQIADTGFAYSTLTAYYPAGNTTWNEDTMQQYSGTVTWVPYEAECSEHNYTAVVTAATCQSQGYTTYTCSKCGDSYVSDYTDPVDHSYEDGYCRWCGKGQAYAKIHAISASLGGNIAMNFVVEVSEDVFADPDAYINFSFAGRSIQVPLSQGKETLRNGVTVYEYSCPITAKNMTDDITAQVMNASGPLGESKTTDLVTYADKVLNLYNDGKLAELLKAMLNYGAAAQEMFNYRTDDLANAGLSDEDKIYTAVDASAYAYSKTGSEEGIKANTCTLLVDSETVIMVYYTLTGDRPIEDYTFTINGEEVTPVYENGRYYIKKTNISAHRLDEMYEFTCGGLTITYGALSYVDQVMDRYSSGAMFNVASAIYRYSQAAEAYID